MWHVMHKAIVDIKFNDIYTLLNDPLNLNLARLTQWAVF